MPITTLPTFPTLAEYVAAGLDHPEVDAGTFHEWLGELLVHEPLWRELPVLEVVAVNHAEHLVRLAQRQGDARHAAIVSGTDPATEWARRAMVDGDRFAAWVAEMVETPGLVDEVLAALPADLVEHHREAAIAETRPFVFVIERRERWVCTATGTEGSGPVAVLKPRLGDRAGDLRGYEAVVSLGALRQAVEALEDLNADE